LNIPVTISAAYEMRPGRYPELGAFDVFREVLRGALREWKIGPQMIDGLLTTPAGQAQGQTNANVHDKLIAELGLRPRLAETISLGGASFGAMVNRATSAIREGRAKAVLCVGAGKFLKPSEGSAEMLAKVIAEADFEVPYGPFIPALYALYAKRFMHERKITREDFARVAVSARKWALLNPDARMYGKGELTVQEVIASRPIAEPFHYLDCSIPSDGGGAILVTCEELGHDLAKRPAYVLGYGEYHPRGSVSGAGDLVQSGAVRSGTEAFDGSGLKPSDIDAVQLYDAFSATPLMLLENLGFCAPGTSGEFVQSGAADPGGRLPMNTFGGLLSFGHTGDASGMSVLIEGAKQAMGTAGARQVACADKVLVHCYGGMMYDHTTVILGAEP
jgi:acetyl-CoA acetyltransferase